VFKTIRSASKKGTATREHVRATALALFRRRGFERTTMRDVAEHAGLSLGAAYHYFRSKDAIVLSYYEWTQAEHERLAEAATAPDATLRARLLALFETKLALLAKDRKLLAALFTSLGNASHPLSLFGKRNAKLRARSIRQFTDVLPASLLDHELRTLVGQGLWLGHLALLLFFIHDRSPRQARTRDLAETLIELVVAVVPLLALPVAAPMRERLATLTAGFTRRPRSR
jgi:AcrR family transcriptional regulator